MVAVITGYFILKKGFALCQSKRFKVKRVRYTIVQPARIVDELLKGLKPGQSTVISACLPIISAKIQSFFWRKVNIPNYFRQKNDRISAETRN